MRMRHPYLWSIVAAIALLGVAPGVLAAQDATPAGGTTPADGWELRIDSARHFPGDPEMIAVHYCKQVADGMFQCQLYAGDEPDAPLIGVEVIVDAATFE